MYRGTMIAAAMTVAALGLAGTAAAAPSGGSNAQETINRLTAQGYSVQINRNGGWWDVPLSECFVSGLHGLYPDVACSTTE